MEERFHRGSDPCVIALASSRGGCDGCGGGGSGSPPPLQQVPGIDPAERGVCAASCWCGWCVDSSNPPIGSWVSIGFSKAPLIVAFVCRRPGPSRALWCRLWHGAHKKHWVMTAACTQTQSGRLLSASCVVFTVLFCPNQGRLWGICQVVFPLPHVRVTFCFHAYFRCSLCVEIQTLSEVIGTWKVSSGSDCSILRPAVLFRLQETLTWIPFVAVFSERKEAVCCHFHACCGTLISLSMLSSGVIR